MSRINNLMTRGLELTAQMSIGQAALKCFDKILWIIEKSVQWSLPPPEQASETNGKTFGTVDLVRPLPWIFFLPSLIIIRVVRMSMNIGAVVLGYPRIEPSDMIRFMQKSRRRIRAIKSNGLKNMRQKNSDKAPTTIGDNCQKKLASDNAVLNSNNVDSKRKYSELSTDEEFSESDDELLGDKLDRLAVNDSCSDEDFSPQDVSMVSDSSSADSEINISMTEVHELKAEKEQMEKGSLLTNEKDEIIADQNKQKTMTAVMTEQPATIVSKT